jgi:glycosyltransferase involved in cell wall biosynthesis
MRQAVRQLIAEQGFDLAHVQLARMAPYAEDLPLPRFVDLVDALSLSTLRRSDQHRGPLRWLTRLEARRLLRYERRLCGKLDGACVASSVDRDAIDGGPGLGVVPNGVDLERFRFERTGRDPATVVFTGNMGYFPNVNAVRWFAGEVWPLVRQQFPGARLDILGARPAAGVRRLASAAGAIRVLGWVEDVRAHLRTATVSVAPMQAGAGQQFKVLEAMASGAPVVATPIVARGLEAGEGDGLIVSEAPGDFARAVVGLLGDPGRADRLATRARRFVEERYSWERSTSRLEELHEAARAHAPTL